MAIVIGDTLMTDDASGHRAQWRPEAAADGGGAWISTRVPGRLLDRNQAISSLVLAELESGMHRNSPHARQLRAALGLGEVPLGPPGPPQDAA